ncbi:hypothetical protein NG799_26100 [Laspinema sp. D1]|uniref:Uncharacterized protein n=1 Tax=Laspinema palackyanum D2a TaxID=2953684 RepID=A0ABT2MYG7_9CYAN|nr:hypothetical protein [Laspinema sp. D2a]
MKESTETFLMLAQLLETEPPILQREALSQVEQLAAQLDRVPEGDEEKAAAVIIDWSAQFPQEQETLEKAVSKAGLKKERKELDEILENNPRYGQWIVPNFEIIEEPETQRDLVIITPEPSQKQTTAKMSPLLYLRQSLQQWIHKNQ